MTTTTAPGTALITGASSGIGALYADRLAKRGHDLILVARSRDRLDALATRLAAETGRTIDVIVADLTEKADVQRVEERLRSDPSITMLVNNAGFSVASPIHSSDPDRLETMIQLNVIAPTRLARAAAPVFAGRGHGTIINIASIVALAPEMLNGTYSGTKAYMVNFSQALHHELAAKGVRVQAVLPGATRTDFWESSGLPVQHLPQEIVMAADEMVDASLAGLDQGELITIPSLPDVADWQAYEKARTALGPNLSRSRAAARYAAA
jgi:short-subunit dehydrogenase